MKSRQWIQAASAGAMAAALGVLVSCKLGPNYERPALDVPATYKGATTREADAPHLITNWWLLFNDGDLTALEDAAIENNYDLKAAVAKVAEARAAARVTMSQYYPQITLDPSATWTFQDNGRNLSTGGSAVPSVRIPFDLGYEVDLWGQVARSVESAEANTRAQANQFAVVLQTLEADVAQDYMNLRSLEQQDEIFSENVKLTQEQLDLTRRKLTAGIVGQIDIAQAQTQLDELLTQQIDIRRQRQDTEHALAILTGRTPAEFAVGPSRYAMEVPLVPPGLPGEILRHRPDVASAEENLIGANADIGVAIANFYPAVRLSGAAGFESVDVQHTLDWSSALLTFGPSVSLPIFEGGKLDATLEQSKARYRELLATYRSTILAAFRDVEVSLTDVHMHADALAAQHRAVESAREYLRLSRLEYDQGLVSYFQLLDADRTLLTNEVTESQLLNARLVSTVLLIKALGGGWTPDSPLTSPVGTPEAATRGAATQAMTRPVSNQGTSTQPNR